MKKCDPRQPCYKRFPPISELNENVSFRSRLRLHCLTTIFTFILGIHAAFGQVPTISSFSPASAVVGTTITIIGTNFNTTAGNNVVLFGATKATVTSATTTQLVVTVPVGATYAPITVLNATSGLITYANSNFTPAFAPNKGSITTDDFATKVDFGTGSGPFSVSIGDLDGDGKAELAVANSSSNSVSVFRNTSTSSAISFAPKQDFSTGTFPFSVSIGDLDGDGKSDLATANFSIPSVSVLRNTSVPGTISFAPNVDFTTASSSRGGFIGDLDGDGKADIVVTNGGGIDSVSVLRNTSTPGTISFAPYLDFTTGRTPFSVSIGDLDGDGKADLAIANALTSNSSLSVLRNTSTSGTISFAAKVDFVTATNPTSVSVGDLDGDGKADIATANNGTSVNTISVFRNTSTSGTISFAPKLDFNAGSGPFSVSIGDLDGDGKADLAVANRNGNTISVFKNTSTSGTISFATKLDLGTGTQPISVSIADLDGDGKADLATANNGTGVNTVSVIWNDLVIPKISIKQDTTMLASGSNYVYSNCGAIVNNVQNVVFTIANTTRSDLLLNSIAITGDFSVTGSQPTSIAGNSSVPLTIGMNTSTTGAKSGIVSIKVGGPTQPTYTLNFSGSAALPNAPSTLKTSIIPTDGEKIYLSWTDNSSNECSFELQRSVNNDQNFQAYQSFDTNIISYMDQANLNTVYYYRVRAVNPRGVSGWSNTVGGLNLIRAFNGITAIEDPEATAREFLLYPNPVIDQLNLTLNTDKLGEAKISILDSEGQLVTEQHLRKNEPLLLVTLEKILPSSGLYFIKCQIGDKTYTRKVIKE